MDKPANLLQLTPKLYRSARPQGYAQVKALGVTQIIVLQSGLWELFTTDNYEREFSGDYGIQVRRVACNDFLPPIKHLRDLIKIIKQNEETGNEVILFHCKSGVDRTGSLGILVRVVLQGWTFAEAYAEWIKLGRHWWYDWWKHSIKKLCNELKETT